MKLFSGLFSLLSLLLCSYLSGFEVWIGTYDDGVYVYDSTTDELITKLDLETGFNAIAFSPNGSLAYIPDAYSASLYVVDTATKNLIATITIGNGNYGATVSTLITSNGRFGYFSNQSDDSVSVVDLATNVVIATIPVGNGPYFADSIPPLVSNPDGTLVFVPNKQDDNLSVIEVASNRVIATITVGAAPSVAVVTPDGKSVYVSNVSAPDTMSVIDIDSLTVVDSFSFGPNVIGLTFNSDGSRLYGTGGSLLQVIDPSSNTIINTVTVATVFNGYGIAITPDDKKIYYPATGDNRTYVLDAETLLVTTTLDDASKPNSVAIKPELSISAITAKTVNNEFLTQTDIVNTLSWGPVINYIVSDYKIYRDVGLTELIASVPASGPLTYKDHNRRPNTTYTYYIVAENNGYVITQSSASVATGN